jgi:CDP-paratose 2-epimerase
MAEAITGRRMRYEYIDCNRQGDHICYISDLTKIRTHYPAWEVTKDLEVIVEEICSAMSERVYV